ncbi:putative E3 ubiquitin-protein ligase herc4 [Tritrichomonas musculus]|uniref:E3 ubiquitin-protein ligase herc4 n=1 Tax=Tritrichomonas musculus TaxID=1915356 RepID=A0ABR2HXE9_9EUKA
MKFKEGLVFAFGTNGYGQLGLGKETEKVSTFTKISSLSGNEIRAVYAGLFHSFFETREGKILACGRDHNGELFLNGGKRNEIVYLPTETTIQGAKFSILGDSFSAVFIGGDPPPNTPNMHIRW